MLASTLVNMQPGMSQTARRASPLFICLLYSLLFQAREEMLSPPSPAAFVSSPNKWVLAW
jgi:hypothetical protein